MRTSLVGPMIVLGERRRIPQTRVSTAALADRMRLVPIRAKAVIRWPRPSHGGAVDVRFVDPTGVTDHRVDELASLLARDDGLVWVDIPTWDEAAVAVITDVFQFHPMAVRDCAQRNQVPKVHMYARSRVRGAARAASPAPAGTCTTWNWTSSSAPDTWSPCTARSTRRSTRPPRWSRSPRCCIAWSPAGCARPTPTSCPTRWSPRSPGGCGTTPPSSPGTCGGSSNA